MQPWGIGNNPRISGDILGGKGGSLGELVDILMPRDDAAFLGFSGSGVEISEELC